MHHSHILLTGTDRCCSKLSKNMQFEKDIHINVFFNISENLPEDESPKQGLFQKKRPFLNPEFEREDQRSGI